MHNILVHVANSITIHLSSRKARRPRRSHTVPLLSETVKGKVFDVRWQAPVTGEAPSGAAPARLMLGLQQHFLHVPAGCRRAGKLLLFPCAWGWGGRTAAIIEVELHPGAFKCGTGTIVLGSVSVTNWHVWA